MSKDSKKSYEEVHKRLGEELEKAYLKREIPDEKVPKFDLSFLDEDPEDAPEEDKDAAREKVFVSAKTEKKRRFSRFTKVAAVVIIFLLCTNIFLLGKNSSESYGDKGILHRLYQGVTGLFTDSEEQTEDSDVEEFMTFDSLGDKELKKAKEFLPGLYVPTYMPEGYELGELKIEKFYSGDYWAKYCYKNSENNDIFLYLGYVASSKNIYEAQGQGDFIELNDRKIFVTTDDISEEQCVSMYTESCSVDISGPVEQEDLVKIAEGMMN